MFCKDADKEDSPDLEALLGKFVNIEHRVDATYVDENDVVSKETFSVLFVMNKDLVENKDLKSVIGPIVSVDDNRSQGMWSAVYDDHVGVYNVKTTCMWVGEYDEHNYNTELEFIFGSKTGTIYAHAIKYSSDTDSLELRSNDNNITKGVATISLSNSPSCTLRGNCWKKVYNKCYGIHTYNAWNKCITQ